MEEIDFQSYADQAKGLLEQAKNLDPFHYAVIGGVLLIILIWVIFASIRGRKKRKARSIAPNISIQSVQVAPLGKGLRIKFVNMGFQAIISDIVIKDRNDIVFTQAYKDYLLEPSKYYDVFCEVKGSGRADNGFTLILHYTDQINNVYQQQFYIEPKKNSTETAKIKKYV